MLCRRNYCEGVRLGRVVAKNAPFTSKNERPNRVLAAIIVNRQIADMPLAGSAPEEIVAIGLVHYRQRLVGQTRVIYQIKEAEIFVHMFVDTNRDFVALLYDRLMRK